MIGTAGSAAAEPTERQTKRKKGKGRPPDPPADACAPLALAHAAVRAMLCTLAASSDAARLGVSVAIESGSDATEEPSEASCNELALSLVEWLRRLPTEAMSGKCNLGNMCTGMGFESSEEILQVLISCLGKCPY